MSVNGGGGGRGRNSGIGIGEEEAEEEVEPVSGTIKEGSGATDTLRRGPGCCGSTKWVSHALRTHSPACKCTGALSYA